MDKVILKVKDACVAARLAKGPLRKAIGFALKRSTGGSGMLFQFSRTARHAIWMMGMRFPIDVIWLNESRIVGLAKSIPPPGNWLASVFFPFFLERYRPMAASNAVLELESGFCERHGVEIGDRVMPVACGIAE